MALVNLATMEHVLLTLLSCQQLGIPYPAEGVIDSDPVGLVAAPITNALHVRIRHVLAGNMIPGSLNFQLCLSAF